MSSQSKPPGSPTRASVSSASEKATEAPKPDDVPPPEAPGQTPPSTRSFLDHLPAWISTNLRSPRSRKTWFRCWLACWAAFVILLPQKSLNDLGIIAWFSILVSFFLPPYLPIQIFVTFMSTIMLGLLISWGLGAAAMRAGNAARDQAYIARLVQAATASIMANPADRSDPALALKALALDGYFLEIKTSAVYGCFLGSSAFIFALVRAYSPKLQFFSIFGTIGIDVFCTVGPLFPTAEYFIMNPINKSAASYMAIAVLCTVLVFPETVHHLCMSAVSGQLARAQALLLLQDEVLDARVEAMAPGTPLVAKITQARVALIGTQRQLMATSGNINLEFSRGKWNGDDVREIERLLLAVTIRIAGLLYFPRLTGLVACSAPQPADDAAPPSRATPTGDSYILRQLQRHHQGLEAAHALHINDVLPVVKAATADLRGACVAGLAAAQAVLDGVNTRRWTTDRAADARVAGALDDARARLAGELGAFKDVHRARLVAPFRALIAAATTRRAAEALPLCALYLAYVYGTNVVITADAIAALLGGVADVADRRRANRVWAPKGLRAVGRVFLARGGEEDGTFGEDTSPQPDGRRYAEEAYARDPDSRPPTNAAQRVMNSIYKLWRWSATPEAVFTFKYVFISIALWIPAVCKSSAGFYYRQKGIWALVMAQTILNVYAADQMFNFFIRITGTFLGLVAGLAAWYIGNGSGTGTHYGAAAAYGLVLIPVIFTRVFSPVQYLPGAVLGCATFALVVGYSWIDGHTVQVVTPGIGWTVAWKRAVLVLIGCAAGFVMMMLPPKSGRRAVRLRNASSVMGLSRMYGFLVATWISAGPHRAAARDAPAEWVADFRAQLIALAQEVDGIKEFTRLARWEGSARGAWPVEEYMRLAEVQTEMIGALVQLSGALSNLEDDWRVAFLHSTRALNPNFIGDVVAIFSLVSQSLRTGEPMHQVLPSSLVERLFYHHDTAGDRGAEDERHIDVEQVQSLDYMYYANGFVAVYQLLLSLDELHRITKRLCGEVPLQGFATWRADYERKHVPV